MKIQGFFSPGWANCQITFPDECLYAAAMGSLPGSPVMFFPGDKSAFCVFEADKVPRILQIHPRYYLDLYS